MKQFKALVIKDFWLFKTTILIPVWIFLGQWAINLISCIYNSINPSAAGLVKLTKILPEGMSIDVLNAPVSYVLGTFIGVGSFGLCSLMVLSLSQFGLNYECEKKSELFYRTQPVNAWKFSLARFSFIIVSNYFIAIVLALINLAITNWILSPYVNIDLALEFSALFSAFFNIALIGILTGSFFYLWSAIFRSKAFLKASLLIGGLSLLAMFLNAWWGWNLPVIGKYLIEPFKINMDFSITSSKNAKAIEKLAEFSPEKLYDLANQSWKSLISLKSFAYLLTSIGFFSLATFIYKRREVR